MSRRYYKRRSRDSEAFGGLIVIVAIGVAVAYERLSQQALTLLFAGLLFTVAAVILLAVYLHSRRTMRERKKLKALSMVDVHAMDGLAFERYIAELLRHQGYTNVTLTEKYDYGVDIIAVKDGIRWGIQVKRYSDMVKAAAVRQVVTALNHYKCHRAMVVTNSIFSRPAKSLAASNNCILIDRDRLAEWLVKFRA